MQPPDVRVFYNHHGHLLYCMREPKRLRTSLEGPMLFDPTSPPADDLRAVADDLMRPLLNHTAKLLEAHHIVNRYAAYNQLGPLLEACQSCLTGLLEETVEQMRVDTAELNNLAYATAVAAFWKRLTKGLQACMRLLKRLTSQGTVFDPKPTIHCLVGLLGFAVPRIDSIIHGAVNDRRHGTAFMSCDMKAAIISCLDMVCSLGLTAPFESLLLQHAASFYRDRGAQLVARRHELDLADAIRQIQEWVSNESAMVAELLTPLSKLSSVGMDFRLDRVVLAETIGSHLDALLEWHGEQFSQLLLDDIQLVNVVHHAVLVAAVPDTLLSSRLLRGAHTDCCAVNSIVDPLDSSEVGTELDCAPVTDENMRKFAAAFGAAIFQQGHELVEKCLADTQASRRHIIPQLLLWKSYLDEILRTGLRRNPCLVQAYRAAFENILNEHAYLIPRLLARQLDETMRAGPQRVNEMLHLTCFHGDVRAQRDEIFASVTSFRSLESDLPSESPDLKQALRVLLDRVLSLFRFVQTKDVFEAFHRRAMGRRLLLAASPIDHETEWFVLGRLESECGKPFVGRCERMLKETTESASWFRVFEREMKSVLDKSDIKFSVFVLSACVWGSAIASTSMLEDEALRVLNRLDFNNLTDEQMRMLRNVKVPPVISELQSAFEEHYVNYTSMRRVMWLATPGRVQLAMRIESRRYELIVSLQQAVILLEYNHLDRATLEELAQMTEIPLQEIKKNIVPLFTKQILRKTEDGYCFNSEFESSRRVLKIYQMLFLQDVKQSNALSTGNREGRDFAVDAAVLRIMKTTKSCTFGELYARLTATIEGQFHCSASKFKARVEALMAAEYLERNDVDADVLHYVP
ncbi:MAG: hypothetical protein KVP17_001254 [Porospora cf. gigantea B]|uniref:uncharacterized protein n=1 Tax=Porospora cf. gigantea B TaxID=2853592 RepID=UPI003571CAD9|nr:MAG: hypothetical protein KVP17_001254 [Porospora cf. gigantea B]